MKGPRTPREHDLVVRARDGDRDALRALLEEHEASLRRRIAEFEDRGDGAFEAWLAAIADRKLREVLALVQVEGLRLADAAARMGRSYEATKKLYGRAASRLAKGMATGRDT
jgi:hypothetical protein